jgi:hypothetical protein
MQAKLLLITLAVDDLERSVGFYVTDWAGRPTA